jgi:hypothetical protein
LKVSQLNKIKLNNNEEEIKRMNTEKKKKYKTLSEKIKNVETLNKISSSLDYQKHLLVNIKIFFFRQSFFYQNNFF